MPQLLHCVCISVIIRKSQLYYVDSRVFVPIDDVNGEQQDETFFVGQRSGRVIRPLSSGEVFGFWSQQLNKGQM